ncbi:MAG: DUF624 domain-containing protein [Eubacteriales bacterium]|nr:DUF624 domain-containing protein [Eubacteriales bacterium]
MGGRLSDCVNGMFDPENRFWMFMEKVMNVLFISILWLVCSLPIITMGAATVAVFQFTLHQVRNEEGYVWKSFFKAFKQNFRSATVLWLMQIIVGTFLLYDIRLCFQIQLPWILQMLIFIVLACVSLLWLLTVLYIFPLLSFFQIPVKKTLVDSFIMAVGNLPVSFMILLIYAGFTVLAWTRPCTAVFCVGLAVFVSSYLFHFVFSRYLCLK